MCDDGEEEMALWEREVTVLYTRFDAVVDRWLQYESRVVRKALRHREPLCTLPLDKGGSSTAQGVRWPVIARQPLGLGCPSMKQTAS